MASVGDKVRCSAEYDIYGTHLAKIVREGVFTVGKIRSDGSIQLNDSDGIIAVVSPDTVTKVEETAPIKDAAKPAVITTEEKAQSDENQVSQAIEGELSQMLDSSIRSDMLKYSMRLFGIPHQFTEYCDYRVYTNSQSNARAKVGRTFIENILYEAPVLTVIPGKPLYLPGAKNKKALSLALMQGANGKLSSLIANLDEQNLNEKLRYYDFSPDYLTYMKFVNILCASAAAFLDLGETEIPGPNGPTKLTSYLWQNYRWESDKFEFVSDRLVKSMPQVAKSVVSEIGKLANSIKSGVTGIISSVTGSKTDGEITAFDKTEDEAVESELNDILQNSAFVQFFVDSGAGMSESSSNAVTQSKLQGIFDSASDLSKEVAFIANSGSIKTEELTGSLNEAMDALNEKLFEGGNGAITTMMSRLLSAGSNIIKGDTMIFPQIYQNSTYTKTYQIKVDLRAPLGNRLSYFLNILVPLFHLMALALPRQSTANSYSSPFLVKAYIPGVISCNLGIVQSIAIEKASHNADAWTVDGFPNEVSVTLDIVDLYSDLSMTPNGDITLFLANSSLVEYIATNCGVNLVTPQLSNRVSMFSSAVVQGLEDKLYSVTTAIQSVTDPIITSFLGS